MMRKDTFDIVVDSRPGDGGPIIILKNEEFEKLMEAIRAWGEPHLKLRYGRRLFVMWREHIFVH
jgi:hypothetical protein